MASIEETPTDIESMLRYTGGKLVEFGDATTYGHYDVVDDIVLGDMGGVVSKRETLTIATGTLTGMRKGMAITVGGIAREIGEAIEARDDGKLTEVQLRKRDPRVSG